MFGRLPAAIILACDFRLKWVKVNDLARAALVFAVLKFEGCLDSLDKVLNPGFPRLNLSDQSSTLLKNSC